MRRIAVKSASRTLEVLELFQEHRRPLRLNEIYPLLGYPQSSAINLLKSMVMTGYLNYNRTNFTYLPTARVTALGNWLVGALFGQKVFQDLLERVQNETDETITLITQNDLFIQYVRVLIPDHEHKMPPPEGTMRVMSDSSAGMALMSRMTDRQVDQLCRQIHYYELSKASKFDGERVLKDLSWVRHVGYCHMPRHPNPLAASIAFPMSDTLHGIPLALGVGGMDDRISRKKHEIVQVARSAIADFPAAEVRSHATGGIGVAA